MEFLDNAVTKAKEVFDVACKKTGEAVTIQKQKFDIGTEENKVSKLYEKLGKIYFESFKDTQVENEEMSGLIEEIKEKNKKIELLKEEINTLKNKRVCPNCSTSIDKASVFCSKCGTKLEIESED